MSLSSPREPYEESDNAIADYRQQSRVFLNHSRDYLQGGDWHQASEKGWAAAAWMAKAVAEAQGWQYNQHGQFFRVMRQCQDLSQDPRLPQAWPAANVLHTFFYTRKTLLDAETIEEKLSDVATLLEILEPLTHEKSLPP